MKPTYQLQLATLSSGAIHRNRIGAAWEIKTGNYVLNIRHMPITREDSLLFIEPIDKSVSDNTLATVIADWHPSDNVDEIKYRIVSATQPANEASKPWFEGHGAVVLPLDQELMVFNVRTLPLPYPNTALYLLKPNTPEAKTADDAPKTAKDVGNEFEFPPTVEIE